VILDTNAVSALLRGDRNLKAILARQRRLAVSIITVGEYRYGIRDSRHGAEIGKAFDALLTSIDVLLLDKGTTRHYADLASALKQSGTPVPQNDLWIASHAAQYRMPVLTRDRHFNLVEEIETVSW
jgi:predicted nucleic acid-binding protein